MNQKPQPPPREHHFYVAIAKFLFRHPEHGIVWVRDPIRIKEAEQYGLSPLILYGLTVARLPIRWMTFTPVDRPRALREVLLEAWRNAGGLRGRPDILRINRRLAKASPELVQDMAKIGVRVEVADALEKSLPASLGSAQGASRWLLRKHKGNDRSLAGSLQALCRYAQEDHDFRVGERRIGVNSREVEDRVRQWLALPAQVPVATVTGGLDWEPGPWLSSWETSLPPDQPRYFNLDGFNDSTWLMSGEKRPEDLVGEDDYWADIDDDNAADIDDDNAADIDDDNAAEIAKNLVECWPNPPAEIARCAGITLRELQWFISGKASLDQKSRLDLEALLGIEYDENRGGYKGAGPYVLVARKSQALMEVYDTVSGGGDAQPYEIVPRRGAPDPSWRYVLINAIGEPQSIIMAPRGAKIAERLPDLLWNYVATMSVAPKFYRDVVSTCARACREPAANIREMQDFAKRYDALWADCTWEPE